MSELDGVTLSQSDIWQSYTELQEKGLISSTIVGGNLLLRLTPEGDQYCRFEIFPQLVGSGFEVESEGTGPSIGSEPSSSETKFADNLSIDQIRDHLLENPNLIDVLKNLKPTDGVLNEDGQAQVRRAVVQVERLIADQGLANFEAAQARSYLQVVMVLTDAPSPPKADMFKYIQAAGILFGMATAAGTLTVAIMTYLTVHGR